MSVTAIIPMWNRADLTRKCLASLSGFSRVIVVDDGSDEPFAEGEVIRLKTNQGFAAAVNAGWRAAETDHVAVINNDVTLHPGWVERLVEAGGWFATGKLLTPDGRIDGTYDLLSRSGFAWRCTAEKESRHIKQPSFTAVLLRTELREKIGLLDESFGSYYEDVEYGVRLRKAGLTGRYVPTATGVHEGSATAGVWSEFMVRQIATNHARMVAKHWGGRHGWQVRVGRMLWRELARRRGRTAEFPNFPVQPSEPFVCDDSEIAALQDDTFWRWYFRLAGRW